MQDAFSCRIHMNIVSTITFPDNVDMGSQPLALEVVQSVENNSTLAPTYTTSRSNVSTNHYKACEWIIYAEIQNSKFVLSMDKLTIKPSN